MEGRDKRTFAVRRWVRSGVFYGALLAICALGNPASAFAQVYGAGPYGADLYGPPLIVYGSSSGGQSSGGGGGGGGGGSISPPVTTPVASSTATTTPSTASTTPPSTASSTSGSPAHGLVLSRTLTLGDIGTDVRALQEYMKTLGYLVIDSTTDFFGKLTSAAVQKYQCAKGIVCSGGPDSTGWGSVGPLTLASLALGSNTNAGTTTAQTSGTTTETQTPPSSAGDSLLTFTRVLYRGLHGNDVSAAQSILQGAGYVSADSVTGYFGVITWNAVMKFQCDKGIVCTGDEVSTGWGTIGPKTAEALNSL